MKSRKLIGGVVIITLATIIALCGSVSHELFREWADFIFLIYTAYVAGNVGSKFVTKKSKEDGHTDE